MNEMNSNKKILFLIGGFFLLTAAIIGVLLILGASPSGNNTTTQPYNDNVDYGDQYNASVPSETNTTSAQLQDSPAMQPMDASEAEIIEAYISGSYYMSAVMYVDGVPTDMNIAIRGHDFHTTINVDGLNLGLMFLNNKVYLINADQKKFIDFESIASLAGGQINMDMSELKEVAEVLDMTKYNFYKFEQFEVEFNGQPGKCYNYFADELTLYFYFVNGELKQVDFGDVNGKITTTVSINQFSPSIPSDMITLIGLKKATVFDFFGEEFLKELM